ncbi:beta-galactosidase [Lapidilactobacillus achengensis]|uniref:Beta-galactosidase n=1 Tax=Lapidilactobacillus achengensis TaxID=2486000 RepID=A0ABW1UQT8_9LACO
MIYGGDYNPEQWPENIWLEDMHILKDAHINSATINVFSWAILQPSENEYDFRMLDKIVSLLTQNNYRIVMGTSTAALPAWMSQRYPDVNRTDFYGLVHKFGHRHNFCPNSPSFRKYEIRLVKQLAERYGQLDSLVCWHISNEYSGECYCENCAKAFRVWLKDKYSTIEAVNQAWNTNLWSHKYYSFEEIIPPNFIGDGIPNEKASFPGLSLDYSRFNSDSILNTFKEEKKAIRLYDAKTPVTTNLMGAYKPLDYFKFAKEMDIISWDSYPTNDTPNSSASMMHDLMRGLKNGQPFMMMEQTPSQQNWQPFNALKLPGQMRNMSYNAIAHGADTVQFFQLRKSIGGAEKFHGAVIDHVGTEEPRVFKEVQQLGNELQKIGTTLLDGITPAKVALLFDWENYWALEYAIGPNLEIKYVDQIQRYYDELYTRNIPIDFVSKESALDSYSIVIAPCLYLLDDKLASKIEAFTESGGIFVTTTMSGLVDSNDNIHLGGYPGPLKKVTGVWVEEFDAMPFTRKIPLHFVANTNGKETGTLLCDIIHPKSADVVAEYGSGVFYEGLPAITRNHFGNGTSFYIGTVLNKQGMKTIFDEILNTAGIKSTYTPEAVSVTLRVNTNGTYIFIINHSNENKHFDLDISGNDILTMTTIQGQIDLAPFGVSIIKSDIAHPLLFS